MGFRTSGPQTKEMGQSIDMPPLVSRIFIPKSHGIVNDNFKYNSLD